MILVVPQRVPESYVKSAVTENIEDRLGAIREQILSRTRLEAIINDLNLYPDLRRNVPDGGSDRADAGRHRHYRRPRRFVPRLRTCRVNR